MLNRPVAWLLLILLGGTLLGLALVWQGGTAAHDDAAGTALRVGYAVEAPYITLDARGRVSGESAEVLRATWRSLGQPEPVWVPVPFSRLIHQLEMGRIDVIAAGLFITPERSRRVDFSRPTLAVNLALLVRRGNPDRLRTLSDLSADNDLRLATLDGAIESRVARAHGISARALVTVSDVAEALKLLRAGEVAAFALSAPSLRHLVRHEPDLEWFEPADLDPERDIGLPAYAWRPGDPRLPTFDAALGRYLGSAEHLQTVRALGYTSTEIQNARRHADAAAQARTLARAGLHTSPPDAASAAPPPESSGRSPTDLSPERQP